MMSHSLRILGIFTAVLALQWSTGCATGKTTASADRSIASGDIIIKDFVELVTRNQAQAVVQRTENAMVMIAENNPALKRMIIGNSGKLSEKLTYQKILGSSREAQIQLVREADAAIKQIVSETGLSENSVRSAIAQTEKSAGFSVKSEVKQSSGGFFGRGSNVPDEFKNTVSSLKNYPEAESSVKSVVKTGSEAAKVVGGEAGESIMTATRKIASNSVEFAEVTGGLPLVKGCEAVAEDEVAMTVLADVTADVTAAAKSGVRGEEALSNEYLAALQSRTKEASRQLAKEQRMKPLCEYTCNVIPTWACRVQF